MSDKKLTREDWLRQVAEALVADHPDQFDKLDLDTVRIGVGFTKGGARSTKVLGQAFIKEASTDETCEIILSVMRGGTLEIASTLAHEVCHARDFVDGKRGHGPSFGKLARAIGLEGRLTATVPGEQFEKWLQPVVERLGEFPHAPLKPGGGGPKKQTTRMIKVECAGCGFTFRTSAKWLTESSGRFQCPDAACGDELAVNGQLLPS